MTEFDLDAFDRQLLRELQRDCRQTHDTLSAKVNLSASAVRRRLRRLRDSGLVAREVAILDRDRHGMTVIIGIRCAEETSDSYARLLRRWQECSELTQIYNVSGDVDFVLIGQFANMPSYNKWLKAYVIGDPEVERCDSNFVFEAKLFETAIPVDD